MPVRWLRMFDARELGIIISGSSAGFDVADLKQNTVYGGGYTDRSHSCSDSCQSFHAWQLHVDRREALSFDGCGSCWRMQTLRSGCDPTMC